MIPFVALHFQVPLGFDNVAVTAERPPQQPGRRSFTKKAEEDLESVDSFWGVGTATTTATNAGTPVGTIQTNRTPGYDILWIRDTILVILSLCKVLFSKALRGNRLSIALLYF